MYNGCLGLANAGGNKAIILNDIKKIDRIDNYFLRPR